VELLHAIAAQPRLYNLARTDSPTNCELCRVYIKFSHDGHSCDVAARLLSSSRDRIPTTTLTAQCLKEALTALEDGQARGLVVYKLDRLARNLTIQETTLALAWGLDATVYAVDLGEVQRDDPDDPMKAALRQMVGVFAQLERGMIAARLRAGRRLKAARGGYAGGAPPFGWRAEGRELVADAEEQATRERIIDLRGEGLSLRTIAAVLAAEGRRSKRGGRWYRETLRQVLAAS
jgi:DNA invertase Pin-like site-specific DNA recombinase